MAIEDCEYSFLWFTAAACPLKSNVQNDCRVMNPATGKERAWELCVSEAAGSSVTICFQRTFLDKESDTSGWWLISLLLVGRDILYYNRSFPKAIESFRADTLQASFNLVLETIS